MARFNVLSLLLVVAIGCDESPTGPTTGDVTFGGVVVDYITQSPVVGATVIVSRDHDFLGDTVQTVTDASGRYSLTVAGTGPYSVRAGSSATGSIVVNGLQFRGDLFTHGGTCRARYGIVVDARTLRPIQDALVTLAAQTVRSAADGWYRVDLDCPPAHIFGNTTLIYATKSGYQQSQRIVGRGVQLVARQDIAMTRE